MDIREKMHSGDLYLSADENFVAEQLTFVEKLYKRCIKFKQFYFITAIAIYKDLYYYIFKGCRK